MKEQIDELLAALSRGGCSKSEAALQALLDTIQLPSQSEEALRSWERELLRAAGALRGQKCFLALRILAERVKAVADDATPISILRHLAQARIELGALDGAIELLNALAPLAKQRGTKRNRSEVAGLLGRARKQQFVEAVKDGSDGAEFLRKAIEAYASVYDLDEAWHGANLVALIARAERDGIDVGTDDAETWARRLLDDLGPRDATWSPWYCAAAGEAYLALPDKRREAATCFNQYWNMPTVDGFALAGTARQLREIWQITRKDQDEFRASLLLHLEAQELDRPGGGESYTPEQLMGLAEQLRTAAEHPESVHGAVSALTLNRVLTLLGKAQSVCRVVDANDPDRGGTGFLLDGRLLQVPLDRVVLLTNHHVLYGPEASDLLLARPDYAGATKIDNAQLEFHYWGGAQELKRFKLVKVIDYSPRHELDFCIATIEGDIGRDHALDVALEPHPLGSRNHVAMHCRPQVFVLGHPRGGDLSFGLSDSEVVDHELVDNPGAIEIEGLRRIHYRTPTEGGSSGSPVLHWKSLRVVGLHRSGHAPPLREEWARTRQDEPYEANEGVSILSVLRRA